jgi:hypothetical protein
MSALAPRAKYPSFSFAKPGDKIRGIISQPIEDRQARVYGKEELDWWDDAKTQPVMQTRIVLKVSDGTEWAIYPKAGSRMAKAITGAIIRDGAGDLAVGGELEVSFPRFGEGKNPAMPPKEYESEYVKPSSSVAPAADPWADDEPPF